MAVNTGVLALLQEPVSVSPSQVSVSLSADFCCMIPRLALHQNPVKSVFHNT